jgi:hypothetical protein
MNPDNKDTQDGARPEYQRIRVGPANRTSASGRSVQREAFVRLDFASWRGIKLLLARPCASGVQDAEAGPDTELGGAPPEPWKSITLPLRSPPPVPPPVLAPTSRMPGPAAPGPGRAPAQASGLATPASGTP